MDPSYNNSFGSFSSGGGQTPQPIMSPVGGDIILTPSQPVKKKKTGLIIAVILILIAIGAGVAAVMLMGKGGRDTAFNDFTNLVLYNGTDKYPNENGLYAIQAVAVVPIEEEMDTFYDKVREIGNELINSDDSNKELVKKVLLWTYVADFYNFYDDDTVTVYESSGYETAKNMLSDRYNLVSITDDSEYSEIVSMALFAEEVYLDYVNEYESGGCSLLREVDDCVAIEVETDKLDLVYDSFGEVYDYARDMINDVVMSLAGGSR